MAFIRSTKKDGTPQRTALKFSIGPELEAKLKKIGQIVENLEEPSPDLLEDLIHTGADQKLEQLEAQSQRIDGLDDRLRRVEEGIAAILQKLDGPIRTEN